MISLKLSIKLLKSQIVITILSLSKDIHKEDSKAQQGLGREKEVKEDLKEIQGKLIILHIIDIITTRDKVYIFYNKF